MAEETANIDALYVLGDLFEMWIGDDDNSPFHQQIKHAFKQLTDSGTPCYFIHGNRDFLVGKQFSRETGVTLLDEHTVVDLYGTPTLILHGDTLCTQDESYQKYRKKVHNRFVQWLFLRLPLSRRLKIGAKMRQSSSSTNQQKDAMIMDVDPNTVDQVLINYGVTHMIHGHTHRPNVHQIEVNNQPATRTVLGDWYDHGSVLVVTPTESRLETRQFQSQQ